jgi:hypothetical protein
MLLENHLGDQGFELVSWQELSDFYDKTLKLYDRQFGVLWLIILLMVLLSVTNSVNMSLFERTREFGTLLALGDRPRRCSGDHDRERFAGGDWRGGGDHFGHRHYHAAAQRQCRLYRVYPSGRMKSHWRAPSASWRRS